MKRRMDKGVLVKGGRFRRARFIIVENRNRTTCGAQTKLPIMNTNDTLTRTGKNYVFDYFMTFMYFTKTVDIKVGMHLCLALHVLLMRRRPCPLCTPPISESAWQISNPPSCSFAKDKES